MEPDRLTAKKKIEASEEDQRAQLRSYVPEADVFENDEALWLWVNVPGADPGQVTVELEDNVLSIVAEAAVGDYERLSPVYAEYNVGRFLRRFTLAESDTFDGALMTARLVNGVLEVKLPKRQVRTAWRIPVTEGRLP